jgi:hypothetical protein
MMRFIFDTIWRAGVIVGLWCAVLVIILMLGKPAHAGGELVTDECLAEPRMVNVKFYRNKQALRAGFERLSGFKSGDATGFTTYNTRTEVFTLHAVRGRIKKSKGHSVLGHEVLHALCGQWHSEDGRLEDAGHE